MSTEGDCLVSTLADRVCHRLHLGLSPFVSPDLNLHDDLVPDCNPAQFVSVRIATIFACCSAYSRSGINSVGSGARRCPPRPTPPGARAGRTRTLRHGIMARGPKDLVAPLPRARSLASTRCLIMGHGGCEPSGLCAPRIAHIGR